MKLSPKEFPTNMATCNPAVSLLRIEQIQALHEASLKILSDTGIMIHHPEILKLVEGTGARVETSRPIAHFSESLVMNSLQIVGKKYVLNGRDPARVARFNDGDLVQLSSPGQYRWLDLHTERVRPATLQDARDAIRLADALPNINFVGAMAQPAEISEKYREVVLTAELSKGTTKPTMAWTHNGKTARYVLEIYRTLVGGEKALRERPMTEAFLEPISPLQLPNDGLDMVLEFAAAGQPVSVGPMAMTSGTAPATLAATLAQENAEILAGIVVTQLIAPGIPMKYGGIPHILDPRTSICSFGSPEQALMGMAMVAMGKHYGLPIYINVGLTDAKVLDAQAGIEKATTLVLGALAGADMFGHAGICGPDHAGSLAWLMADNEVMAYVKRVVRGFGIAPGDFATDVIQAVGPAGSFLAEDHTIKNYRRELWMPGPAWTRQVYGAWEEGGRTSMGDRLRTEVERILSTHTVPEMDAALAREIDRIVACAKAEIGE
ncbi:MAG TPA: trimethylamine methyltransferase family protein [Verrucomicrobiota bacterium]|nr:trimethylamine methyltransferase family protein [Verrucomicrobiota bacterium]